MGNVRGVVVALSAVPWIILGPLNIFKVAHLNRGSPIAAYIVVPPAETCQSACNIARMWACLFWGLQTIIALSIATRSIAPRAAAAAKAYVGIALIAAYLNDVVREPVAVAGSLELAVALLLATAPSEWPGAANCVAGFMSFVRLARSLTTRYGKVFLVVHWGQVALFNFGFWYLLGEGYDVVGKLTGILPFGGEALSAKLATMDTTSGGARLAIAYCCTVATVPLRVLTDALLTISIGELLARRKRPDNDKKKAV